MTASCRCLLLSALFLLLLPHAGRAAHGISLSETLKYPPDFTHVDYADPDAPKGGKLILHSIGSFDQMNPFILKGTAPLAIDSLVFEQLAEGSLDEPFAQYGLIVKDIDKAADNLSVVFTLNDKARFSDGSPVTVDDIAFSLETLKSDKVHPFLFVLLQGYRRRRHP